MGCVNTISRWWRAVHGTGQSRLTSFNVCNKMSLIFYQSVVASALFFAVVSDNNKLIRKAVGQA